MDPIYITGSLTECSIFVQNTIYPKHILGQILIDLILYIPVNSSFSYVRKGLPGLNQYLTGINASCSRKQHSDAGEFDLAK